MNFANWAAVVALLLAGCLPPKEDRIIPPKYINQRVMQVKGWDVGCDNQGQCIAIAAVPPRKAKMDGIRAALRIDLNRLNDPAAGMTIIPLDFEQRLPDVRPSPEQASAIMAKLKDGRDFMIWLQDEGDGTRYYLPGQGFAAVEALHRQWRAEFPVRLMQEEAIKPAKAVRLHDFLAPALTAEQLAECEEPGRGRVEAAWDVGGNLRLFQYACSAVGRFYPDSLWFMLDKPSGRLSPIGIDEATGPKTDGKAAGLHNAYFDENKGLLVTRKYVDASRNCGLSATYAATPSGFVLAVRREARHCVGLLTGDWIQTYRSPAVILPEQW